MRKIAFGALLVGLLVACGSSKSNPDARVIQTIDSAGSGADAPVTQVCNVIAQTGCNTGEKCTWVRVAASSTQQIGQLGCVMDGTAALNAACTYGTAGATTGFDNCQHGLICLANPTKDAASGTCIQICDLNNTTGTGAGACGTNEACGIYSTFFSNSSTDTPLAGECEPECDPLTNTRLTDNKADCGGTKTGTPPYPDHGCYGFPSGNSNGNATEPTHFTCSPSGDKTKTERQPAADAATGNVYLNGCAVGFIPLLYDMTGSTTVICVGYCQPVNTNLASHPSPNGGTPSCTSLGGATTDECKFLWWFEDSTVPLSSFSHNVGFCFDYSHYMYDSMNRNPPQPDTGDPSCKTLDHTKMSYGTKMVPDDVFWGCVDVTARPLEQAKRPFKPIVSPADVKAIMKAW